MVVVQGLCLHLHPHTLHGQGYTRSRNIPTWPRGCTRHPLDAYASSSIPLASSCALGPTDSLEPQLPAGTVRQEY